MSPLPTGEGRNKTDSYFLNDPSYEQCQGQMEEKAMLAYDNSKRFALTLCTARLLFVVTTSLLFVVAARLEAATVVSPPDLGLEDTDGDILFIYRKPYPERPPVDIPESTLRWQEVHPASAFESLGPGPLRITQMAWRPDVSVFEPIRNDWEGFRLLLATTDAGLLEDTFAENWGPRGATEVFFGTLTLQTDGSPRGPGLPHDFDYVIEFERPFTYYPDEGDLLFDASLEVLTNYPWVWMDAQLTGEYIGANPLGPIARNRAPGLFVTEFTAVPEPTADFDGDGDVDGDDVDALVGEIVAGTNDWAFDLSADGAVNNADLSQWLVDVATANGFAAPLLPGDANLDGSVDSADLNSLALSWHQEIALWSAGDFTADGVVNSGDLNELALNWRRSIPIGTSASAPVPEPSSLFLTVVGLALAWRRRRCN